MELPISFPHLVSADAEGTAREPRDAQSDGMLRLGHNLTSVLHDPRVRNARADAPRACTPFAARALMAPSAGNRTGRLGCEF